MAVSSLSVTAEPEVGSAEVDICELEININYEVIPSIVCSVFFSLGLIYCFLGTLPQTVHSLQRQKGCFPRVCAVSVFMLYLVVKPPVAGVGRLPGGYGG